jgi:hypothetical protein
MRFALATLLSLAALNLATAPAFAAERQVWGFVKSDEDVQLFYGIPESDGLTIAFFCKTRTKRIEIISSVLTDAAKKGQSITTTLSNGADSASYDGNVAGDNEDGLHFAASAAAERKVTDFLKSGKTLTIRVRGKLTRVPLRGVSKPLAEFEKFCFG